GYQQHTFKEQDPINIEAVEIMGGLHDALKAGGYNGYELERFLVRVLFCLFAQCTRLFEPESFRLFIENRTAPDGSDLGEKLARLFEVLNTPPDKRQKNLEETLAAFPYVNGDRSTGRRARLEEFHDKLCQMRFLDPACGCGNFLVIGYRELRQLELETLKEIFGKQKELTLDEINKLSQVDVDQFYGIEIGEWPVR